jgi:hypothetical protein
MRKGTINLWCGAYQLILLLYDIPLPSFARDQGSLLEAITGQGSCLRSQPETYQPEHTQTSNADLDIKLSFPAPMSLAHRPDP